jgi:hypothetical protein
MLRRKRALEQHPHLFEILFTINANRLTRVLLERPLATDNRR